MSARFSPPTFSWSQRVSLPSAPLYPPAADGEDEEAPATDVAAEPRHSRSLSRSGPAGRGSVVRFGDTVASACCCAPLKAALGLVLVSTRPLVAGEGVGEVVEAGDREETAVWEGGHTRDMPAREALGLLVRLAEDVVGAVGED